MSTQPASSAAPRVLVVTAGMGAGHLTVAAELDRRLTDRGVECTRFDVVAAAGAAGDRLVSTYRTLLAHAPWVYGASMRAWAAWPGPFERLTARNAEPFEHALCDAIDDAAPDVVVATYNLAAQCLGRLRHRDRIACRLVTLVTDPGAHPYWLSPETDVVCAPSAGTAADLADYGAGDVRVTAPLVPPRFSTSLTGDEARERTGLASCGRVALVTGGSWAAGHVSRTVRALRHVDDVTPVVLCGRDERLREAYATTPDVVAVGWTDQVPELLAAADVVIDNAGGQTCWEALASGTPVVIQRPLAGHGRLNAVSLLRDGLVAWPRTRAALDRAVRTAELPSLPVRAAFAAPDAADVVLQTAAVSR